MLRIVTYFFYLLEKERFFERIRMFLPTKWSQRWKKICSLDFLRMIRKMVMMRFNFASCFFVKYFDVCIEYWYSLLSADVPLLRLDSLWEEPVYDERD